MHEMAVGKHANFLKPTLLATAAVLVSSGIRNTTGLLVNPLVQSTALSLSAVSMAMAVGQLAFGLFQPLSGLLTVRYKTFTVLVLGVVSLVAGLLGVQFAGSLFAFILCFGLLLPAGSAASSFPVLMGHISHSVPDARRSLSGGIINAGVSAGQFVLAPLIQIFLNFYGLYGTCVFLAGVSALSLVPAWFLCRTKEEPVQTAAREENRALAAAPGLKEEIAQAFRQPAYVFLHCGFFACGFHVAFLATHLPGEISFFGFSGSFSALCFSALGLCNIAGCILAGIGGGIFRPKNILAGIYCVRLLLIGAYIFLPKTAPVFIVFAAIMGLTYGSTVPPTAAITSRLVSPRNLSTLFALIFLTHQAGSFFGAWLGGFVMQNAGSFMPVWFLDAGLSLFAAVISFKIYEYAPKH